MRCNTAQAAVVRQRVDLECAYAQSLNHAGSVVLLTQIQCAL